MNSSRRTFLSQTALGTLGLYAIPRSLNASAFTAQEEKGGQRGLLFDASDLPRLRETVRHPRFAPYWKSLVEADLEADRKFLTTELKLNNHVKHLLMARQALERTSFVFALTGDPKQLDIAKIAIQRILEYKKWDYFLEGGTEVIGLQRAPETTIAMSMASEWLGSSLSPDVKAEMEKQIAEKGAPACYRTLYGMKYPDRVKGWGFDPESDYPFRFDLRRWPFILNATNLKVIPIAGLGVAGCLLRGKHPQAQRWVDLALQSAKAFSTMFGPDGSYEEGVGYWGYTAQHMALFLEVLRRTTGTDESGMINFPGTARYGLQMSMPTTGKHDDCVNFSDAYTMGDVSAPALTAHKLRDGIAQTVATTVGDIHSHLTVIWFDPAVPPAAPGPELLDVRFANDWVVSRSGWGEKDGVVALRSGGPSNHEHADRNSVIFKAYGERLFHDPFHAAYSYTEPHWLLRTTAAHTAVLIDGQGHQYHDGHEGTNASLAEANVVRYSPGKGSLVVTSDATPAYRLVIKNAALVQRTLVFIKPDILLLLDRIRLEQSRMPVQIRFQANNDDNSGSVTTGPGAFRIDRPGASLHASVHSNGLFALQNGTLNLPKEYGVHKYAEIQSGNAPEHTILTVCTAQESGKNHGVLRVTNEGPRWKITGTHNGVDVNVVVDAAPEIPGVTIA